MNLTLAKRIAIGIFAMMIFLSISTTGNAQSKDEKKILKKARKELAKANYEGAKDYYEQLLNYDDNNPDYYFELGLTYYNSNVHKEKSVDYFNNALSSSKEDTIAEIFYYLAQSYQFIGDFENAILNYNKFRDFLSQNKGGLTLSRDVGRFIEMCNNGEKFSQNSNEKIKIKNLGENINTDFPEYASVVKRDESVIIFTGREKGSTGGNFYYDNKFFEDIYVSHKENGEWVKATKFDAGNSYINSNVNSKWHDAAIAYSQDEQTLYIYRKNDVWESHLENDVWTEPIRMNSNINTKGHEPSVYLNLEGNMMILTSNRKGGMGGRDLYMSEKNADGVWGHVMNLGSVINTPFDEDAPFLTPDGSTLYFSSTGHNTMGGYDIFKSTKNADGNWGEPVNLGAPFNTAGQDIYYTQNPDSTVAYLSSDRAYGFGDMDIYRLQLKCENIPNTEIRGLVLAGNNLDPVQGGKVSVYFADNTLAGDFPIDSSGKYLMVLPPDRTYRMEVTANNYFVNRPHEETFTLPEQCNYYQMYQEITIKRYKDKIVAEGNMTFNNQVAHFHNAFFDIKSKAEQYLNVVDLDAQNGNVNVYNNNDTTQHYNMVLNLKHNDIIKATNVEVYLLNQNHEIIKTSKTDKDGAVTFYDLDDSQSYNLMINENDAQLSYYGLQPDVYNKSILIKGKLSVEKLPINHTSINTTSLPDIEVKLADNDKKLINTITTDKFGNFVLDNLPTDQAKIDQLNAELSFPYNLDIRDKDFVYSMYIKSLNKDSSNYSEYIDVINLPDLPVPSVAFANVLFDFDKYFLRNKSKETLDKIYSFMNDNPNATLKIAGHTDWIGTDEYNLILSENRSISAYDYLVAKGIDSTRLTKVWFGESQPVASNAKSNGIDDPIGRQLNRRCEFELAITEDQAQLIFAF